MSFLWNYRNAPEDNDDESSLESFRADTLVESQEQQPEPIEPQPEIKQETTAETTVSATAMTWNEAHRAVCCENSSLMATPQQIMSFAVSNRASKQSPSKEDVPFETSEDVSSMMMLPSVIIKWPSSASNSSSSSSIPSDEVIQQLSSQLLACQGSAATTTDDNSPTTTPASLSWTRRLIQAVWNSQNDEEEDSFDEEEDDCHGKSDDDETKKEKPLLRDDEPILHVELTQQILHFLRQKVQQETQAQIVTDWNAWCNSLGNNSDSTMEPADLFSRLPRSQQIVCWKILQQQESSHAAAVSFRDNLLLVGPATETEQETLRTLHKLDTALQKVHQQQETLTQKANHYGKLALQAKKQGRSPTALLQTRHLFLQKLQQEEQIVLNLEASKLTLQNAAHNSEIVQVLQATTDTLQKLSINAQDVQQVLDEHEVVRDELAQVDEAIAGTANTDNDDEELLAELEHLTLDDAVQQVDEMQFPQVPSGSLLPSNEQQQSNNNPETNDTKASSESISS